MGLGGHPSDRPEHQRNLASSLEILDELLNTLTDVLDIREVFDRVLQLVQRVLPHDVLESTGGCPQDRLRQSERSLCRPELGAIT